MALHRQQHSRRSRLLQGERNIYPAQRQKDSYGVVVDETGRQASNFLQINFTNDLLIVYKTASLKAGSGLLKRLL